MVLSSPGAPDLAGGPRVMDWLGHANLSMTQLYDQRDTLPADTPTFKVSH